MAIANASVEMAQLYRAINNFSNSLYKEMQKTEGNLFFSPFSCQLVLFLASIGAKGKTFEEMRDAICLPAEWSHVLQSFKSLLTSIDESQYIQGKKELKISIGEFIENSFGINISYVKKGMNYLNSTVEKLNFKIDPNKERRYLNEWFSKHAEGVIEEIFPEGAINENSKLVLGNAIHFNNLWRIKFQKDLFKEELFYNTLQDTIRVMMMTITYDFMYYNDSNLKFSALNLPYANHNFKLLILLPDAKDGLSQLETNLSIINDLKNKMRLYKISLTLPKFKIEQSSELKSILSDMGCSNMFSDLADFSGITQSNPTELRVTSVLHKACVDVNKNGTTADVYSGVKTGVKFGHHKNYDLPEATFVADHPFIFSIFYKDIVLFMGRLKNL